MFGVAGKNKLSKSKIGPRNRGSAKVLPERLVAAAIVLLLGLQPLMVRAGMRPVAKAAQQESAHPSAAVENYPVQTLQGLVEELKIPPSTVARFEAVYWRHRPELYRIMTDNPGLLWKALGLVMDALPALRQVQDHQGKLVLTRILFARANNLWRQLQRLSSPGLAGDLQDIKTFVDRRTRSLDAKHVEIDLNG